jgi:uncharacterized membrane protein YvbJ
LGVGILICSQCGNNNPDGSAFCVRCGSALNQAPPQNQYVPPQNQYAPPQAAPAPIVQNIHTYQRNETVTMGEWFVFFLLMCIPIVNIIMLFVWAFGSDTKPSKANLCKLQLLLMAIGLGLALIIGIITAVTIGSFLGL